MLVHRNFEIRRAKEFECCCCYCFVHFYFGLAFFSLFFNFSLFFVIDTASHFDIAQCVCLGMKVISSERFFEIFRLSQSIFMKITSHKLSVNIEKYRVFQPLKNDDSVFYSLSLSPSLRLVLSNTFGLYIPMNDDDDVANFLPITSLGLTDEKCF